MRHFLFSILLVWGHSSTAGAEEIPVTKQPALYDVEITRVHTPQGITRAFWEGLKLREMLKLRWSLNQELTEYEVCLEIKGDQAAATVHYQLQDGSEYCLQLPPGRLEHQTLADGTIIWRVMQPQLSTAER